jgi:N-methylhydantoinase B
MVNEPIYPGEICYTKSPGGGGWGDPLDRDVRRVKDDVIDGIVSIEAARDLYGVVMDPKTYELQIEATERLRKEIRAKQKNPLDK